MKTAETPTPRTDTEIEEMVNGLKHMADDHLCCRATVLDAIELINQLKRELNEALYTASEMAREAVLLRQALEERKQELNEARREADRQTEIANAMTEYMGDEAALIKERDQLRKVCDEQNNVIASYDDTFNWRSSVVDLYDSLPHVQQRKTK